jgi:hypothetical protein
MAVQVLNQDRELHIAESRPKDCPFSTGEVFRHCLAIPRCSPEQRVVHGPYRFAEELVQFRSD